jgi:hypothetical protein
LKTGSVKTELKLHGKSYRDNSVEHFNDRTPGYDFSRATAFLLMLFINYWVILEDDIFCPVWLYNTLNSIQGILLY